MSTIAHPIWFLLALPIVALMFFRPAATRTLAVIRVLIFATLITAIADPLLKKEVREGTLTLIVDRSESMPIPAKEIQQKMIEELLESKRENQKLRIVSFGDKSAIESSQDLVQEVGNKSSRLADALELALLSSTPGSPERFVVVSDGNYTHGNPAPFAAISASRKIPIDYRLLSRSQTNDLGIVSLDYPVHIEPNEIFMVTAWVQSPLPQDVNYTLYRGDEPVASGRKSIPAGTSSIRVRDILPTPQTGQYVFDVQSSIDTKDPMPENNRASFLVRATGNKPVLILTEKSPSPLKGLLELGGLSAEAKLPGSIRLDLATLSNYSGVIIENVPHQLIGDIGVAELVNWVKTSQGGLLLTGGQRSFGQGGYYQSALDPILPVSMELRKEFRKASVAMMLVLDRSGSMTAPASGGKTKMDLANIASANVVDLLTPMDEVGVLAVDTTAHTIVKLQSLTNRESIRRKILKIQSMGGGIYVYEGLSNAVNALRTSSASSRHIILFSDANDSENPAGYKKLLAECEKEGITCSVIALGKKTDVDAALLIDVATRGKGRVFFTTKAKELPELFAQDTFTVARSFIDEIVEVQATPNMKTFLPGIVTDEAQGIKVGGYNMTYLRDTANLAMVTKDDNTAPLLAAWHVGLGRTAVYTGQIDGKWTGPIAAWEQYPKLLNSLSRWFSAQDSYSGEGYLLTQRIDNGVHIVTLHLDSDAAKHNITTAPRIQTLSSRIGEVSTKTMEEMTWISPQQLEYRQSLDGEETHLSTVILPISDPRRPEIAGTPVTLAPAKSAYPAEFQPIHQGFENAPQNQRGLGQEELDHLARQTGGQQRLDMQGIWESIPSILELRSIASWLYMLTMVLVLTEVLERRTGYVGQILSVLASRNSSKQRRTQAIQASRVVEQGFPDDVGADDGPERSGKSAGWRSAIWRIATLGGLGTGRPENSTTGPRMTSNTPEYSSPIDESTDTGGSTLRSDRESHPQEESKTGTVTDALAKARAKSRDRMKK